MTGRLRPELLERFLEYAVRVLKVAEELERDRRPRRVVDQITGSGTSPAAQMYEANEAVSRADFLKSLGWAAKELGETRFWLQLVVRMQWLPDARITPHHAAARRNRRTAQHPQGHDRPHAGQG